jgi:DNA-binding SARP family transcriptional activator
MLVDGRPVNLGERKQRTLLALLALDNKLVAKDRLERLLWEKEAAPQDPPGQIHGYVARLRRAIEAASPGASTVLRTTRDVGYQLDLDPAAIDYHRFREAAAKARAGAAGDPETVARHAKAALDEWGAPAGVRGGGLPLGTLEAQLGPTVQGLRDQYQAALMTYLGAELACGRHEQLIAPLAALAGYDEHGARCQELARLRALAIHRTGNKSAALEVLEQLREVLHEDGGDLDPATRELRIQIMADRLPSPAHPPACELRLTHPDGAVSAYALRRPGRRVGIGRAVADDPAPDIVVDSGPSSPVSRQHAWLESEAGAWWLVRAGKNPTLIRYRGQSELERVDDRVRLRNGDVIVIRLRPAADGRARDWEIEFLDPQETTTA